MYIDTRNCTWNQILYSQKFPEYPTNSTYIYPTAMFIPLFPLPVLQAMAFYVFLLATSFIGGSSSEPCALKEWLYESSEWAPPGYHVSLGKHQAVYSDPFLGWVKKTSIAGNNQKSTLGGKQQFAVFFLFCSFDIGQNGRQVLV